jgi:outer membrane lipoprotein-sorting protein
MSRNYAALFAAVMALGFASAPALAQTTPDGTPAQAGRRGTTLPPPPTSIRPDVAQNLPTPVRPSRAPARGGPLDANQRTLVERVNGYLTGVRTLVGDFVQMNPSGTRTEGKFYLQKPGRVRFEYNPPNPLELIADGRSVAIRDRRLATQDLLLLSQTPLRFLLSDRIDLFKESNIIDASEDGTYVKVTLEERQTLGGTHRLQLMFGVRDLQLKQWTITDPQGYDTTVALYNLDANSKPDAKLFVINYERLRD